MGTTKKTITERFALVEQSGTIKVDREKGIAHGIKLNGNRSANKRRYADPVLQAAAPLYEGAKVYLNHDDPGRYGGPRPVEALVGTIKGARHEAGGTRGDLHVRPSMRWILDDIEHDPLLFGPSHVVDVETEMRPNGDGEEVISRIVRVDRVDLVTEPATTRGMFEQREKNTSEARSTMDAEQVKQLYEARLAEKQQQLDAEKARATKLEVDLASANAASAAAKALAESTAKTLEQANKDLTAEREKTRVAEESARKASIAKLVSEAGLPETVGAQLAGLTVEGAKAIVESLKSVAPAGAGSTGSPRSEARTTVAPGAAGADVHAQLAGAIRA